MKEAALQEKVKAIKEEKKEKRKLDKIRSLISNIRVQLLTSK